MSYQKNGGGFILIIFLLACGLPSTAAPLQVSDPLSPELLGTAVVETAMAAQARTAAVLPPTHTPTLTREPASTLIAAPSTSTPFSLFTSIPEFGIPIETTDPLYAATSGIPGAGGVNTGFKITYSGEPWTCIVRSASPRWGIIQPGTEFDAYWTVVNNGTKPWTSNTIDFTYTGGYRHDGRKIQDLSSTVGSGGSVTLSASYTAPKSPGDYNSFWALKVGNREFCGMKISFEVPED